MKQSTAVFVAFLLVLAFGSVAARAQHHGGPPAGVNPASSRGPYGTHGPSGAPDSQPSTGKKSVSDLLTQNPKLTSKIHDLTGMDAQQACSGFKNVGQCVAAAHVSKNLDISFADLKAKMLGTSGSTATATNAKPMSLGRAIQALDPQADAKAEASKGQKQAHSDLSDSGSSGS